MSIRTQLQQMLKEAVVAADGPTKNVVRCLRAKVEQEMLAAGLPRDLDDDKLYLKVIASYRKAMMKAVEMLERGNKGDSDLAVSYRFEISFCESLLPETKNAEETRDIVRTKIAELGASGAKDTGRIIKAVMADHPGEVDAALVSRAAKDLL